MSKVQHHLIPFFLHPSHILVPLISIRQFLNHAMRGIYLALLFPVLQGHLAACTQETSKTYPHIQSSEFDAGDYGAYPNRTYITRPDIISPRLNILQADPRCDDGLYTMISLRGDKVHISGQSPMIHDTKGNLVWMNASYGETFGLNVQRYRGVDYLSFWQGDDSVGGHGEGVYILVCSPCVLFILPQNFIYSKYVDNLYLF